MVSENFTLKELTRSEYGIRKNIPNTPTPEVVENLMNLCDDILELLRSAIKKPIHINSGFRNVRINKGIGGSATSQHCKGEAVDIIVSGLTVEQVFQKIISLNLPFDQLIQEFDAWVHVSHKSGTNRRQILRATKVKGKTIYEIQLRKKIK